MRKDRLTEVREAAYRLKLLDDKDSVEHNSLMIRASLGHGAEKARELLRDLRAIYRYLLNAS